MCVWCVSTCRKCVGGVVNASVCVCRSVVGLVVLMCCVG